MWDEIRKCLNDKKKFLPSKISNQNETDQTQIDQIKNILNTLSENNQNPQFSPLDRDKDHSLDPEIIVILLKEMQNEDLEDMMIKRMYTTCSIPTSSFILQKK